MKLKRLKTITAVHKKTKLVRGKADVSLCEVFHWVHKTFQGQIQQNSKPNCRIMVVSVAPVGKWS